MKKLSEILEGVATIGETEDVGVEQICFDSRKVTAGCLFVAISGSAFDGHDFIG